MENSTLIKRVNLLSRLTQLLSELLLKQPAPTFDFDVASRHQHSVHELPDVLKTEEKKTPLDIPVLSTIKSQEALELAGHYFCDFMANTDNSISTRFTKRLPGVIHVTYDQSRAIALINEINALKNSIKQEIIKIPEKKRFDFVHGAIPGLMTLQVYRNILYKNIKNSPLRNVSLTWARRPTTDNMTKKDVISLVSSAIERSGTTLSNSFLVDDQLLKAIRASKTDSFKRRRYSRPLPIAQLQFNNKDSAEQSNCYLPLLLIGEPLAPYKIKPLKDFTLKPLNKRKKVSKEVLLSESMNIFAIYPEE